MTVYTVSSADDLMSEPYNFYADIEEQLDDDGRCQVDLDDGCCVNCVLYHSDAKNIKE